MQISYQKAFISRLFFEKSLYRDSMWEKKGEVSSLTIWKFTEKKLGIRWVGWAPCWNDLALQEQPFFKTTSKKSSIPVLPQHLIALEDSSSFPLHFFSCSDSWGSILLPGCTEATSISKEFILWIYGQTFKNTRKPNLLLAIVKPQKILIMLLQIGMVMFEFSITSSYFQNYMHIRFHFTVHMM